MGLNRNYLLIYPCKPHTMDVLAKLLRSWVRACVIIVIILVITAIVIITPHRLYHGWWASWAANRRHWLVHRPTFLSHFSLLLSLPYIPTVFLYSFAPNLSPLVPTPCPLPHTLPFPPKILSHLRRRVGVVVLNSVTARLDPLSQHQLQPFFWSALIREPWKREPGRDREGK